MFQRIPNFGPRILPRLAYLACPASLAWLFCEINSEEGIYVDEEEGQDRYEERIR